MPRFTASSVCFSAAASPTRGLRALWRLVWGAALCTALGCSLPAAPVPGWADRLQALMPADVLLLGEQHDAPEHAQLQVATVQWLAAQGRLAAVVMEMAEAGHGTQGLPPGADEAAVRAALAWNDRQWPWKRYGPVVMAAVRAGRPVLGGNLPRAGMRGAMADAGLDALLLPAAASAQHDAVREGHCDLLPEAQVPGMVRIQVARDRSLAHTAAEAPRAPGQTVLLIAGNGHVLRSRGVPVHLPPNLQSKVVLAQAEPAQLAIKNEANWVEHTPALPPHDACAPLRARPQNR